MHLTKRHIAATAALALSALSLTACSSGSGAAPSASAAAGAVNLAAAGCPSTVVIQTDWVPEAEHGMDYQLLANGKYTVDASKKAVTGPLLDNGKPTGVNVQIRAGGPAIAFGTVTAQMAKDPSITLGYIGTDEAIELSGKFHSTAVMGELNESPFMIMWDPATYPQVTDLKSLNAALTKSGGKVIYSAAQAAYMPYLVSSGIISSSNLNGGYTGAPSLFVSAKGKSAQQGFASAEPYTYEHLISGWMKPVKYALIKDSGWAPYTSSLSVRTADLPKLNTCLTKLVPILQQAEVDYFKDPTAAISLILKLTDAYKLGFAYDKGTADYSVATMKADGIAGSASDGVVGGLDESRIANFIKVAVPTFTASKVTSMNPAVTPADIYTDKYIDQKITY